MSAKSLFLALATAISLVAAERERNTLPDNAEAAWKEVETISKPPPPPVEWASKAPTEEQRKAFYESLAGKSVVVADKAKEFYTRFPNHEKAEEAKKKEEIFRKQSQQFRGSSGTSEKVSPEEKEFRDKMNEVQKRALQKRDAAKPRNGMPEVVRELEAGLRDVMKEYPNRPEPWQQLLSVAEYADKQDQLRILGDIVKAKAADEQTISRAKAAIRAVGALGHPLELSFTAADGREVDVQKMKGKVVLIDFWAAWCGPCISSLPEVVELHKKYQPQGFEIVGINLDKDQRSMEQVVHRFKMPWPQYFDGKGWGTKFALEYNVTAIPAVWLVDKKGILRTMNARQELEKQIKELLDEKI
jgi:thiol-disulfide isomerase/thioredoxin